MRWAPLGEGRATLLSSLPGPLREAASRFGSGHVAHSTTATPEVDSGKGKRMGQGEASREQGLWDRVPGIGHMV